MDLTIIAQVVGIVGGIIAIIRGLQELTKWTPEGKPSLPEFTNIVTKLIIALGIVASLYGGTVFISANINTESTRLECLKGKDQNSFNVNQLCDQRTKSQYIKDIKPGLLAIGISFVLIAVALFIRTFRNASVFLFTLELIWLVLGIWLIRTNL